MFSFFRRSKKEHNQPNSASNSSKIKEANKSATSRGLQKTNEVQNTNEGKEEHVVSGPPQPAAILDSSKPNKITSAKTIPNNMSSVVDKNNSTCGEPAQQGNLALNPLPNLNFAPQSKECDQLLENHNSLSAQTNDDVGNLEKIVNENDCVINPSGAIDEEKNCEKLETQLRTNLSISDNEKLAKMSFDLSKNSPVNNNEIIISKNCGLKNDRDSLANNSSASPVIPAPPTITTSYTHHVINRRNTGPMMDMNGVTKEHKNSPSGVKPCGHGTTAISPYVPNLTSKKEDSGRTPPSSPKSDLNRRLVNSRKNSTPNSPNFKPGGSALSRQNSENTEGGNKKASNSKGPEEVVSNSMTVPPATETKISPSSSAEALVESVKNNSNKKGLVDAVDTDAEKKNLINQEAKFQSQLNDLSKQLSIRDAEANKLRFQMEELQRDVFVKSAGMDRLQAELQAAQKESEIVRLRIRHLENDLADFRQKNSDLTAELSERAESHTTYEKEATAKILHLENIIKQLGVKIKNLETQLEALSQEKSELEQKQTLLLAEREQEKEKVAQVLEQAQNQKQEIEKKWKEDFEKLRTINIMKEQQLLDDFEWKLREVQQSCKKRLEEKDRTIEERLQDAYKEAEKKMEEAEQMMAKVETMKSYELEIQQLRGLTADQEKTLQELKSQQEQMTSAEESLKNEAKRLRNLIEMEKENIQHIQRKHHQEIVDKERELKETLYEKRTEIAMYWEERLLTECGRLKSELEQIHNEEKHFAMEAVRREKDEEFERIKRQWEDTIKDCFKEIDALKRELADKDEHYHEEMVKVQSKQDRDLIELRRVMDKIDMTHHNRFEKLVQDHEEELERINEDTNNKIKELEESWQDEVTSLRKTLDLVKDEMERESQQKIESLIEQHRTELDLQWENLIRQKSEAVQLVEDEYVAKYKALEENFYTQQKSHEHREIELLKAIDSMKNELAARESSLDDMQNNVDTLEGGIQVLNQEIAQQSEEILRNKRESEQKIRNLQDTINKLHEQQEKEREASRLKLMGVQKQNQETIDHLHRKCQCLTKLFEEVRLRYERRESRQEDLNVISDLRQVIAEQEKDLACLNEEKRYFQMRLMTLENHRLLQQHDEENLNNASGDEDTFEDAVQHSTNKQPTAQNECSSSHQAFSSSGPITNSSGTLSIPPTIPECDE